MDPLHLSAQDLAPTPSLDLAAYLGAADWQRLSPAIRRRFAAVHADTTYQGSMRLDCSFAGRLFALLTSPFGQPLIGCRREAVPVSVRVRDDGRGGVVWERRLVLDARRPARRLRSVKRLGEGGGLEECVQGGASMALDLQVEDGALVFTSTDHFLRVGPWRCRVPPWLTPGRCRVEHRDEGPGRFRFTLRMTHPWWGETFHQTGVFADPEE